MPNRDLVWKRHDDVRYRVVGDEAVVVRQKAAEVIALNDVGARVLELIDAHKTMGQVVETMLEEYDADRAELTADVETFVEAMREAGIVEVVEPS